MGALAALVGGAAASPPPGAWTSAFGPDLPVAIATLGGGGPPVSTAQTVDAALHLVLVGTIVNVREIEASVRRTVVPRPTVTDADVVLRLFEGRGEQAVSALRGTFALALFDGRRGRLVLARDQLGTVPLYYIAERHGCVASTSLSFLFDLPGVVGRPDPGLVDVVLALGTIPAPETGYAGVRQLMPGELVVWEPGRTRPHRYWQLRFPEAREGRRVVFREAGRRVREQLDDAVQQATSGVVTGMLLSGGLGSAATLALAAALDRRPACAVTIATDDRDADAARAVALAKRFGVEHAVVRPDVDWVAAADRSLADHGLPIGSLEAPLLHAGVAALARPVRAVLLGSGGEEILGGAPAERAWAACERHQALPPLVRELLEIVAATGHPRRLARTIQAARTAPVDVFAQEESLLGPEERGALYTSAAASLVGGEALSRCLAALASDATTMGARDARDLLLVMRQAIGIPRRIMGVEGSRLLDVALRFPLVDARLAQTAAAVPTRVRATPRGRVRLLRWALGGRTRPDLRAPVPQVLRPGREAWRVGSLRALVEETLAPEAVERLGFFEPAAIARVRRAVEAGEARAADLAWRLMLVSRWLARPWPGGARDYSSAPAATSAVIVSSS
jgi:asparagine synthase (glutamine-hydrolysing)